MGKTANTCSRLTGRYEWGNRNPVMIASSSAWTLSLLFALTLNPFSCGAFQLQSCPASSDLRSLFDRTISTPRPHQLQANDNDLTEAVVESNNADDDRRRHMLLSILAGATTGELGSRFRQQRQAYAAEATTDYFSGIIKPPLDKNDYVTYTLPNGLRVLLCSDPSSNEAAAAMDVHVGACSDPEEVPGLAHFTEHMLFLGTKKYPKEDSFESFLSSHGGTSNAFTDSENTVYYFTLNAEDNVVEEALNRFGSFFSSPLFTESATGRELNAIESEHAKNLQSDIFRIFQIMKARANQDHPFSKFFTGNKSTLLDTSKAIDLRNELIQFYNRYYSANQMTLAIVSPQSLDSMQRIVTQAFGDVPNRSVTAPEKSWAGILPFGTDNNKIPSFQHMVQIVPVSEIRQVQIAWPIVYKSDQDRAVATLVKPAEYVAHLLGHEGPRSLLSMLKNKGWVNSLGCATSEELSDFEVFDISVGLTTQGLLAVDEVVAGIYSYLRLLTEKMIPDYILKEVLQLQELEWRFSTTGKAGGYVTSLCTAMQKYPPALYVAGPRRLALDEYAVDPLLSSVPRSSFPSNQQLDRTRNQVDSYLKALTVDNSLVTVLSKSFEGQTDQSEKWYGTNYKVSRIASSTLDSWKNAESPRKLKLDFPKPNPFIPTEAGLRVKLPPDEFRRRAGMPFEDRMQPIEPPRIIRDDGPSGQWTVYFKEDKTFGKPQGYVVFQVLTKEVFASAANAALANLYELSVVDRLNEYAYDASLAGLTYEIKVLPRGVRLTFGGYNDKLKKFASFVSRKLSVEVKDLLPKDDNDFDRYKDQIMRALSAFDVKQPYAHASYYAQLSLQPRRFQYTNRELRDATRRTTLPDLLSYVGKLWDSGKGVALIQGNYDEKEALDLVKSVGDVLPFKPIPESSYPPRLEALPLPHSQPFTLPPRLLIAEPNPSNENCVSHIMLQCLDKTEKDHVLIEILGSIVEEPFYNQLRTKKQLGYIVASGIKGLAETRSISFIVQSNVAPPDALTIEILSFLDTVEKDLLSKLNNGDIAVYAKNLIDKKTEPDKDLAIEVTRNWSEISSGRLQFDRLQQEAASLLDIEKGDLLDFWKRLYGSDERRVLITEVVPRQGAASSTAPPTTTGYGRKDFPTENIILGIDDVQEFRRVRERMVYEPGVLDFPNYSWSSAENRKPIKDSIEDDKATTALL